MKGLSQRNQLWTPGGKQKIPPSDLSLPQLLLRRPGGSTHGLTAPAPQGGGRGLEGALPSPRGQAAECPSASCSLAGRPAASLTTPAARPTLASSPPQLHFSIKVHILESPSLGPGDQTSH